MRWAVSDLPVGWVETTLGEVATWGSGGTPSRTKPEYYGGKIPWIKTGELGQGIITDTEEKITELGLKNSSAKIFKKGSVAIALYGATIGKTSILGIDAATNQACAVGLPIENVVTSEYLYYYLRSQKDGFINSGQGGAQPNISQGIVKGWFIPLAPLDEQKRIAEKLDSLLTRVDSCESHLERVPQILKRFRQSVLAAATSGRLTGDWREEKGQSKGVTSFDFMDTDCFGDYEFPSTWTKQRLKDIAGVIGGITKDSKKQNVEDEELPYLRVANVQRGYLDLSEMKTIRVPKQKLETLLLKPGDVLFNEGGDIDKLGRGWVWNGEIERCIFQNHVFRARLKDTTFSPKYFSHYGNSRGYDYFLAYGKQTTNLASINKTIIDSLPVAVPPPDEQAEIVRRVESLFAYAERLEARYQSASERVARLTPSLLAKGFRGELVEQDPNDEPAEKLLERARGR